MIFWQFDMAAYMMGQQVGMFVTLLFAGSAVCEAASYAKLYNNVDPVNELAKEKCQNGVSYWTGNLCRECFNCTFHGRKTTRYCNPDQNAVCGWCLPGYEIPETHVGIVDLLSYEYDCSKTIEDQSKDNSTLPIVGESFTTEHAAKENKSITVVGAVAAVVVALLLVLIFIGCKRRAVRKRANRGTAMQMTELQNKDGNNNNPHDEPPNQPLLQNAEGNGQNAGGNGGNEEGNDQNAGGNGGNEEGNDQNAGGNGNEGNGQNAGANGGNEEGNGEDAEGNGENAESNGENSNLEEATPVDQQAEGGHGAQREYQQVGDGDQVGRCESGQPLIARR